MALEFMSRRLAPPSSSKSSKPVRAILFSVADCLELFGDTYSILRALVMVGWSFVPRQVIEPLESVVMPTLSLHVDRATSTPYYEAVRNAWNVLLGFVQSLWETVLRADIVGQTADLAVEKVRIFDA